MGINLFLNFKHCHPSWNKPSIRAYINLSLKKRPTYIQRLKYLFLYKIFDNLEVNVLLKHNHHDSGPMVNFSRTLNCDRTADLDVGYRCSYAKLNLFRDQAKTNFCSTTQRLHMLVNTNNHFDTWSLVSSSITTTDEMP